MLTGKYNCKHDISIYPSLDNFFLMLNFIRTCLLCGSELYNLIHEKCSLYKVSSLHLYNIFTLEWETDCRSMIQKENAQGIGIRFGQKQMLGTWVNTLILLRGGSHMILRVPCSAVWERLVLVAVSNSSAVIKYWEDILKSHITVRT